MVTNGCKSYNFTRATASTDALFETLFLYPLRIYRIFKDFRNNIVDFLEKNVLKFI